MTVNERVIHIMKQQNITQKEFASILDISQPVLTYIANGRNKVSLDIVQKIALKYPEINLRWLALGVGEMHENNQKQTSPEITKLIQEVEIVSKLNNSNLSNIITKLKSATKE